MDPGDSSESAVAPQAAPDIEPSAVQARGALTSNEIDLQTIDSIESAFSFLERMKESLEHVPICINQFNQIVYRCTHVLEALLTESEILPQVRVQQAAIDLGEVFKSIHRQLVKSSVYGRPKAFVYREDFAAVIAVANLQLDEVMNTFASEYHILAKEWEVGYGVAKSEDSYLQIQQLESILKDEQNLKIIYLLGNDAREEIQAACRIALDYEDLTSDQRFYFRKGIQSHDDLSQWSRNRLSQMQDPVIYSRRYDINFSTPANPLPRTTIGFPSRETLIQRWNARHNPSGPSESTANSNLETSKVDTPPETDAVIDSSVDLPNNGESDEDSAWVHQPQRE